MYRGREQQKGMGMVPKRAVDVMSCQIARFMQLTQNSIIPISYHVQRKVTLPPSLPPSPPLSLSPSPPPSPPPSLPTLPPSLPPSPSLSLSPSPPPSLPPLHHPSCLSLCYPFPLPLNHLLFFTSLCFFSSSVSQRVSWRLVSRHSGRRASTQCRAVVSWRQCKSKRMCVFVVCLVEKKKEIAPDLAKL